MWCISTNVWHYDSQTRGLVSSSCLSFPHPRFSPKVLSLPSSVFFYQPSTFLTEEKSETIDQIISIIFILFFIFIFSCFKIFISCVSASLSTSKFHRVSLKACPFTKDLHGYRIRHHFSGSHDTISVRLSIHVDHLS